MVNGRIVKVTDRSHKCNHNGMENISIALFLSWSLVDIGVLDKKQIQSLINHILCKETHTFAYTKLINESAGSSADSKSDRHCCGNGYKKTDGNSVQKTQVLLKDVRLLEKATCE